MSQYSQTMGSFTRNGNYPLEADYVFESEQQLKDFYSDSVRNTYLHEGLLKIVAQKDEQTLYWVIEKEGELVFEPLLKSDSLDTLLEAINQINNLEEVLKALVGTEEDIIPTLATLPYTNFIEVVEAISKVEEAQKENEDLQSQINTLKSFLTNLQKELDDTQRGVGLDQSGLYSPDSETYYLKSATSVMNALKTLDRLLYRQANIVYGETDSVKLTDSVDEDTNTKTVVGDVKIANDSDIVIKADGLYHRVEQELVEGILTLKVNGEVRSETNLGLESILEDSYYDTATESIIIVFRLYDGKSQQISIPAASLITEWNTNNTSTISLNKERVEGDGPDILTANLLVNIRNSTGEEGVVINNVTGNVASGQDSLAEGRNTKAEGKNSHAEGYGTQAKDNAHAEGNITKALGSSSHSEGQNTTANGDYSHAEGLSSTASGQDSHAEGYNTSASGNHSHAEGRNTQTTQTAEHAEGLYNISNSDTLSSVGNGFDDTHRHNAVEVKKDGTLMIADVNAEGEYYEKPMINVQEELNKIDSFSEAVEGIENLSKLENKTFLTNAGPNAFNQYKENVNLNLKTLQYPSGQTADKNIQLLAATEDTAGVMSAADKTQLNSNTNAIGEIEAKLEGVTKVADDSKVIKNIRIGNSTGHLGDLKPDGGGHVYFITKNGIKDIDPNYGSITIEVDTNYIATKEYVSTEIANAQLGGGDVDLEGYATEQWVKDQNYLTEHQDISNLVTQEKLIDELNITNQAVQEAQKSVGQVLNLVSDEYYNKEEIDEKFEEIEGINTDEFVKKETFKVYDYKSIVDISYNPDDKPDTIHYSYVDVNNGSQLPRGVDMIIPDATKTKSGFMSAEDKEYLYTLGVTGVHSGIPTSNFTDQGFEINYVSLGLENSESPINITIPYASGRSDGLISRTDYLTLQSVESELESSQDYFNSESTAISVDTKLRQQFGQFPNFFGSEGTLAQKIAYLGLIVKQIEDQLVQGGQVNGSSKW